MLTIHFWEQSVSHKKIQQGLIRQTQLFFPHVNIIDNENSNAQNRL